MINTPLYIARKMGEEQHRGSRVVRTTSMIVMSSVALSISVIIIALSIVSGFRKEVRERAGGYAGQVIVSPFGTDYIDDLYPLSLELSWLDTIKECKNVSHLQHFAFRHGLIKTEEAIQGVVIKGVGKEFDPSFFNSCIVQGRFPQWNDSIPSMELLISKRMSDALALKVLQKVNVYFIDNNSVRVRLFTVSGIFDAALEEFDKSLVIGDIRVVQQLNGWSPVQVGGIELFLHHPNQMERTARKVREMAARYGDENDTPIVVSTVKEIFPHLFDWLNLLDMNLLIVLLLMIAVAAVNMISGVLIMLFDKTSMIGLLKSLGMMDKDIRLTFIYRMGRLILWGMLIGNTVAVVLCLVQKKFTIITLDQTNYAVSSVPINMDVWSICLMNVLSFVLILSIVYLASMMVTRISPERSLRIT